MADTAHCSRHEETIDVPKEHSLRTTISWSTDDLSEEAQKQFGFFKEILDALQLNCREILTNQALTSMGRHSYLEMTAKYYENAKRVLNYAVVHPEIMSKDNVIRRALVVCSLPRTGTTLLYNLLACDPASRALTLADMMEPVPPVTRSDVDGQSQKTAALSVSDEIWNSEYLEKHGQELLASHPTLTYEEDSFILSHVGVDCGNHWLAPSAKSELISWFLDEKNKDFAYKYHEIFMRMVNSIDSPSSHWLFKSSTHGLFLDTFFRYYPTASLIMIHRRLEEVVPSWIRLSEVITDSFLDKSDSSPIATQNLVTEHSVTGIDYWVQRFVQFRKSNTVLPVCDIFYEDLMAEPIQTVRVIYQKFGLTWSAEFEDNMEKWLADNPQGKQGRNTYTLEKFGLTAKGINERYKEYNELFFKSHEQASQRSGQNRV